MMFVLLSFFLGKVLALDAVITVLEAPMLESANTDAQVVQYLRKGDIIKLHPSVDNLESFENLDPFLPTLDRQGHTVWVMREHLMIYSNDTREFTQSKPVKDMTDYRLEEPLPPKYPLVSASGYRGQFLAGAASPYTESYPYRDDIKTKGYSSPLEFSINLLRQVPYDKQDRFYFGGVINVRSVSNSYLLFNNRRSEEKIFKIGIGPLISFDVYKGEENRINLFGQISIYAFNQLNIEQSEGPISDSRTYRALNFSPRLGAQYHRKKIINDIDFVISASVEMETPAKYSATNGAHQDWWANPGADSFTTRLTYDLGAYIGLQEAY